MEKETRSAIERATQTGPRRCWRTEFAAQLEGTFDVLLSGAVATGARAAPDAARAARPREDRRRHRAQAARPA